MKQWCCGRITNDDGRFERLWGLEDTPACDEGMVLLQEFGKPWPAAFELAYKSDFLDLTHPVFRRNKSWVNASVAAGKTWLAAPNPSCDKDLNVSEPQANLLGGAQLVAMRNPPPREIVLIRKGSRDVPALKKVMERNIAILESFMVHPPLRPERNLSNGT